jgi:hypothetical protein
MIKMESGEPYLAECGTVFEITFRIRELSELQTGSANPYSELRSESSELRNYGPNL